MSPLWRRDEPLHERLRREGDVDAAERTPPATPSFDTKPRWGEVGIHGVHRQREWDGVVTTRSRGLRGNELEFIMLADGSLLVEDEAGDGDLTPLADAIEGAVDPPLRASAVRREEDVWVIAARRLRLVSLPELIGGSEVVLSVNNGHRTLLVDGRNAIQPLPSLQALGEQAGPDYTIVAHRLDETLWEVEVTPL